VPEWREEVTKWDATHEGKNPYDLPLDGAFPYIICASHHTNPFVLIGATEGEIRVALLEKEAELAKDGMPPVHAISPCNFIVVGLELEDQQ
jgi:hypothetical protein